MCSDGDGLRIQCPECACDLNEYVLLRILVVGLSDQEMKLHVFQRCESYANVDALRAVYSTYEADRRDAAAFVTAAAEEEEAVLDVAAARSPALYSSGDSHALVGHSVPPEASHAFTAARSVT